MFRSLFPIPVLTLTSLLAVEVAAQSASPTPAQTSLGVNTNVEHYAIERSRNNGEQDLYALCSTSPQEESWAFIRYNNGREVWYENGEKEEAEKAVTTLKPIKQIMQDHNTVEQISFYHFHPEDTGEYVTSETPSHLDFRGYLQLYYYIKQMSPSLLPKLDFRIATTSGMYIFKVKSGGIDDDAVLERTAGVIEDSMQERLRLAIGYSRFNYSQRNRKNFAHENEKFARKYSTGAFNIKFKARPKR